MKKLLTPPKNHPGSDKVDPRCLEYARRFNEKYLPWDRVYYQDTGTENKEEIWALMKLLRYGTVRDLDFSGLHVTYNITNLFQYQLHNIDVRFAAGFVPPEQLNDKMCAAYSVGSLMEESIASSQVEGAVTTTKAAKKMLREGKNPRNRSEQMIINNYRAIRFIRTVLDRELSPELIMEIHRIITENAMDKGNEEYVGRFRDNNGVAVQDIYSGEICHEPVNHEKIGPMIEALCDFANDDGNYVHPIVKGIIIHFVLAYIHPFMDGNGRTSRALFYWYTMKNGYPLMEYLSISKSIRKHRGDYDRAYTLSESDDNDITYFIAYNLDMIEESVDTFVKYLERKSDEQKRVMGSIGQLDLNTRQRRIVTDLINSDGTVSVYSMTQKYQVSHNTARSDIKKLLELGILAVDSIDVNRVMYRYNGKVQR